MRKLVLLLTILAILIPVVADAQSGISPKFSLDPASPTLDGNTLTPADILTAGAAGPVVFTNGSQLGLQRDFPNGRYDIVSALSYGHDAIAAPLSFSVDRVSVGLPGSAVFSQAQPGVAEAAGDLFQSLPPSHSNSLSVDGRTLGLRPGFLGDALTALSYDSGPRPFTYFSIHSLSATNGFGTGTLASNILLSDGSGAFRIFASASAMGLQVQDNLDALVLNNEFAPGTLTPGRDMALFSLSPSSPTVLSGRVSAADVLITDFTGSFRVWASADELGLRSDDNLVALTTTVPGPASIVTFSAGFVGMLVWQRRRPRRQRG